MQLTLSEAQLFRMLTGFFGPERVVFGMSVLTVCSGALPSGANRLHRDIERWVRSNRCLFTVVGFEDEPRMVVEFFAGFEDSIDPVEEEHQRILEPLLRAAGIQYVTISKDEFGYLTDPENGATFPDFLREKIGSRFGIDPGY